MTGKKVRRKKKDRRQRWAAIIAGILAVAMALSAIAAYASHLLNRGQGETAPPEQQLDLETYREHSLNEIKRLEQYISEYGPAVGVLGELCRNFRLLIQIENAGEQVDEEKVAGYEAALKEYSLDLIELEPDNPEYRLQLLYLYRELGEDDGSIAAEIASLQELLHEKPAPQMTLGLIEFMEVAEQPQESIAEEITWLEQYFEELSAGVGLTATERYYYALLLGEHREEIPAALEQLEIILKSEPPEEELHNAAENYQKTLQQREEEQGE
ncbi:MAG: hypothetical protein GX883_05555 [Firmicutes bacterium]|nr:hypothetical protein [Bacillota bacterium]